MRGGTDRKASGIPFALVHAVDVKVDLDSDDFGRHTPALLGSATVRHRVHHAGAHEHEIARLVLCDRCGERTRLGATAGHPKAALGVPVTIGQGREPPWRAARPQERQVRIESVQVERFGKLHGARLVLGPPGVKHRPTRAATTVTPPDRPRHGFSPNVLAEQLRYVMALQNKKGRLAKALLGSTTLESNPHLDPVGSKAALEIRRGNSVRVIGKGEFGHLTRLDRSNVRRSKRP